MSKHPLLTTWPKETADRYKDKGYWSGQLLHSIVSDQSIVQPEAIAIIDGDQQTTYAQLSVAINALAKDFLNRDFAAGDSVVLHMPNCLAFYQAFFALVTIGVKPVLALPLHRFHEIRYFCEHVGAKAYLTQFAGDDCAYREISCQLIEGAIVKEVVNIGSKSEPLQDGLSVEDKRVSLPQIHSNDIAFFLLSGGTTGTPKLIPRTHDDYHYSLRISADICQLSPGSVYLAVMPIAHNFILSSPGALGVLLSGGTVVIANNPDPNTSFSLIEKHAVSIVALVPPLAIAWISAVEGLKRRRQMPELSSLKLLQVGGAKLSEAVAKKIEPVLGCRLQQVFGMAEGLVNYTRLDDSSEAIVGTQGKPMSPADEVRIVDDQDQSLPLGVSGHLLTRGPYTIRGYYNAPEHNVRAFTADGFYRTGDIALLTASGHLVVTGRSKDQINRGGEKISAEEIENLYLDYDGVIDAAVVAIPDPYLGERSCAFVIPQKAMKDKKHESAFKKNLLSYLRSLQIAQYKIPDRIEFIEHFPKTKFGKVDKRALREQALRLLPS